ncbi:hypothetical protein [Sphingobium sp. CFD-2]|uniref:hypothetical protein n=1 Tax=Sphingobium sp. CFD-2 TaxID=2878542 RepID=UPI00214C8C5F|nr:hypothetical protein [Sphingobium sp. CFD-2]
MATAIIAPGAIAMDSDIFEDDGLLLAVNIEQAKGRARRHSPQGSDSPQVATSMPLWPVEEWESKNPAVPGEARDGVRLRD